MQIFIDYTDKVFKVCHFLLRCKLQDLKKHQVIIREKKPTIAFVITINCLIALTI